MHVTLILNISILLLRYIVYLAPNILQNSNNMGIFEFEHSLKDIKHLSNEVRVKIKKQKLTNVKLVSFKISNR